MPNYIEYRKMENGKWKISVSFFVVHTSSSKLNFVNIDKRYRH